MELIERYIYAVTKQLPENTKEDVAKELRANIEDMLPEHYEETDVIAVLQELGNPWKLAEEYQPKQRYLIGPAFYGKYLSVLKLVLSIVIPIIIGTTFLGWLFSNPHDSVMATSNYTLIIKDVITGAIEAGLQVVVWVTIIFIALERNLFGKDGSENLTSNKDSWSIKDLPTLSSDHKKISRSSTVISMVGTVLATSILYFQPQLLAVYISNAGGELQVFPLLNTERLQYFIPIILVSVLIQICIFVWKYIAQYWNKALVSVQIGFNLLMGSLLVWMFNDATLINNSFRNDMTSSLIKNGPEFLKNGQMIPYVLTAIVIVITVWECVSLLIKINKK